MRENGSCCFAEGNSFETRPRNRRDFRGRIDPEGRVQSELPQIGAESDEIAETGIAERILSCVEGREGCAIYVTNITGNGNEWVWKDRRWGKRL